MQYQCQRPGCTKIVKGNNRFCSNECKQAIHAAHRKELRRQIRDGERQCPTCGHRYPGFKAKKPRKRERQVDV